MTTSARTDRWARVEALFFEVLELPAADRAAFLDRACHGDASLREEVLGLVAAHEGPGPIADLDAESARRRVNPGDRIGSFRILRQIGEGGMGAVFLAEREGPDFSQRVALKIIRTGFADPRIDERLREERRILARLEHPAIARFIDGGTTPGGQSFYAMEFVEGLPLLEHCERHGLGLPERLRLFIAICDAVHHAHQQLVVHRDLKPSNILVTPDGHPKLLDFGIATILDAPDVAPAASAQTSSWITPAYASPEQIRRERVTTQTDVYALGILLYEMLAGRRPYEVERLSPAEVERVVCERVPDPPSQAVVHGGATDPRIERLRRRVSGDLDTIALKALAKEPARRYASARELADDVRRHLSGHPVLARPDSLGYRLSRFARRHRAGVVAGALVTVALLGGSAATAWQAAEARRERDRTAAALAEAEAVSNFLIDLFQANDPAETGGAAVTARELLDRGVGRAEELAREPVAQARLLEAIGRVHQNLGEYAEAESLLRRALALRRSAFGEDHPDVARSLRHLGTAVRQRGRFEESEALYRRALAIQQRVLPPGDPELATTLGDLARVTVSLGADDSGLVLYRRAVEIRRAAFGDVDRLVASSMASVAATLRRLGQRDSAEAIFREALEIRERVLGAEHPETIESMLQVASLLFDETDRVAEAEALFRRAYETLRRTRQESQNIFIWASSGLANSLLRRGDHAAALATSDHLLAVRTRMLGERHSGVAELRLARGALMHRAGEHDLARREFRAAFEVLDANIPGDHPAKAGGLISFGLLELDAGDLVAAERLLRRGHEMRLAIFEADHPIHSPSMAFLASAYIRLRQFARAESLLVSAEALSRRYYPEHHPDLLRVHAGLADLYEAWGRAGDAARHRALAQRPR